MTNPNLQNAINCIEQIARGTHDPMPTRRLYLPSDYPEAAMLDEWWQRYFMSMHTQHKMLAQQALSQLQLLHEQTNI